MYSTIKDHKSHVWLTENTSTHRAGSAMSLGGKADALKGWKLSLCHANNGSIVGINNVVSILFFSKHTPDYFYERIFQMHEAMKSANSRFMALSESQWLL